MAAVQTRTRSARLMANLTRSGARHGDTAKEAPPVTSTSQTQSQPRGPSGLSLFLTNLRLLDLDLRPDWPGITAETFIANAQGQKKRVQCVEWALFHLFAIWDPDETRNKLKPFFPPLDQVQSVNLRAALLRALDQAKKNGVLGRDAIVRKTMLDECKGERLEEVLAAFSSAVLKLAVSQENSNGGEHTALAAQLAIEDRGYKSDNTELTSLVWVHKAALTGMLRDKQADQARFRDFAELLAIKEKGIARKYEAIEDNRKNRGGKTMSGDVKLEMRRTVRNNWTGNEKWMETLLSGDAGAKKDGLLGMQFDRVWRRVQQGRLSELEEQGTGLLEQLDGRVRTQRERLEKWENFHRRLCQERPQGSPSKQKRQASRKKGIDLGFGAHEALQVGRASPRKPTFSTPKSNLTEEYHDLVKGLESELLDAGPRYSSSLAFLQRPVASKVTQERPSAIPEQEGTSEVSELDEEEFLASPPIQAFQPKFAQTKRQPMLKTKISLSGEWFAANTASVSGSRSSTEPVDDDALHESDSGDYLSPGRSHSPDDDGPTPVAGSPERHYGEDADNHFDDENHGTPKDLSPSPTQELADHILESMEQASPSPVKRSKPRHTLSLAERTRLTMTRASFAFPDHEEPDLPLPTPTISAPISEDPSKVDAYEDLSSRTRKSMAGFEKARQKAQLERRRSLRKSKVPPKIETGAFPSLDEEGEEDRTMLAEELMAEQDMEAVFRSRPKIKASPLPSPTREWNMDDEYM